MALGPFPENLLDSGLGMRMAAILSALGILLGLDAISIIWLASRLGAALALASCGLVCMAFALLVALRIRAQRELLIKHAGRGEFLPAEIFRYYGLWISLVLIAIPGLSTLSLGFLMYPAPISRLAGRLALGPDEALLLRIHQKLHGLSA